MRGNPSDADVRLSYKLRRGFVTIPRLGTRSEVVNHHAVRKESILAVPIL